MSILKILLLAAIQGAAELLPVSSSAHVILAEKLMGLDPSAPDMTFLLVMLHTGTMGAAIVFFWKRWLGRLRSAGKEFLYQIILATAFTGFLGLALKKVIEKCLEVFAGQPKGEIENLFSNLPLIALALFAAGALILWASRRGGGVSGDSHNGVAASGSSISRPDSVAIGLVQGLCLPFRGFSRSGATISVALMRGLTRETAEEFSFALSVALTPPVIGLELVRLMKHAKATGVHVALGDLLLPGILGMGLAFIAGLGALRWLSSWLESGKWQYFGYYCVGFALLMGGVAAAGF